MPTGSQDQRRMCLVGAWEHAHWFVGPASQAAGRSVGTCSLARRTCVAGGWYERANMLTGS